MDLIDLAALWQTARDEYLKWLLVRKGAAKKYQLRQHTRAAYRSALKQFFRGSDELLRLGYIPPRPWETSGADAKAYKQALLYAGKAESTINQRLAALKVFYRYVRDTYRVPRLPQLVTGIQDGHLWPDPDDPRRLALWDPQRANPFDAGKVDRLPVDAFGRAKFFTRAEFNAILDQIDLSTLNGLRDYALLYFLVTTCRRISEALNLTWGDIQHQDDGQVTYRYIAKGRQGQQDVIGPECWRAITTYLRAAGRLDTIQPGHHVFTGHIGSQDQRYRCDPAQPLSYSTANKLLKRYGEQAGVDISTLHPHAVRHRGLHNRLEDMRRAGSTDLLALRDKAGHKNIGTTEIYLRSTDPTVTDDGLSTAEAAHRRDLPDID